MNIIGKDNRFTLNGVEERVLKRPESRDESITITMAGMAKYAQEMPLVDFEEQTGFVLQGLEPEVKCDPQQEIANLLVRLEDREMKVSDHYDNLLFGAEISYTNANNSKMSASMYAFKRDNGSYEINVVKDSANRNKWRFDATENTLVSVIAQAEEKLDSILKSKVQVLSLSDESLDGKEREYSKEGFAVLFRNESLDDYFKSQDMPAGVVINANNKYQYFHSYETGQNKRTIHYDTKDYKTLRGCTKRLEQLGFDTQGKQLDIFPEEDLRKEFESNVRDSNLNRQYGLSWNDDSIAHFKMNDGFAEISAIRKVEDPKFGFQYHATAKYINGFDGRQAEVQIPLDAREGGNAYGFAAKLLTWSYGINDAVKNNTIEYDQDTRTLDEKVEFHKGLLSNAKTSLEREIKNFKDRIFTNEYQKESAEKRRIELKEVISHHSGALKDLGEKVKEAQNKHSLEHDSLSMTR